MYAADRSVQFADGTAVLELLQTVSDGYNALGETVLAWGLSPATAGLLALVCIVGAMSFLPRPIICTSAGFVFGYWAAPITLVSLTLGAVLAFLAARYFARGAVTRFLERRPRAQAVLNAVEAEGWRVLVLLRLGSPIPSSVQSYLYGVTNVPLWTFASATFVGVSPSVFAYVYLGVLGRTALADGGLNADHAVVAAVTVVATLAAVHLVGRRLLRAQAPQAEGLSGGAHAIILRYALREGSGPSTKAGPLRWRK